MDTCNILEKLAYLKRNVCVIGKTSITLVLADNQVVDKHAKRFASSFTSTTRAISLKYGNRKSVGDFEKFLKRNACCGAQISVFLHDEDKSLGTIIKHGELFVPPGVCKESLYNPKVPTCYRFKITEEELASIRLEGFEVVL
jgi:hypothetical protein